MSTGGESRVTCERIGVVTLFPELVAAVAGCGVTGRAVDREQLELQCYNPRDYTDDPHRTVDDRPYGGGPGMVMKAAPLEKAIEQARQDASTRPLAIYLSPQGQRLDQTLVERLAGTASLLLVAGRYEGVDERLIERQIDMEISIGDYVLSGGELAAMVIIDAVARQIPGVLGHPDSAMQESFAGGGLLEHPQYTRPEDYLGSQVPSVLLGGNHGEIARWRRQQSLTRTGQKRPDILESMALDEADRKLLKQYQCERRCAATSVQKQGSLAGRSVADADGDKGDK